MFESCDMVVKNQRRPKFRRLDRIAQPEKSKHVNSTEGRCGEVSGAGRYRQLGGGVGRYGELRGGVRRYGELR